MDANRLRELLKDLLSAQDSLTHYNESLGRLAIDRGAFREAQAGLYCAQTRRDFLRQTILKEFKTLLEGIEAYRADLEDASREIERLDRELEQVRQGQEDRLIGAILETYYAWYDETKRLDRSLKAAQLTRDLFKASAENLVLLHEGDLAAIGKLQNERDAARAECTRLAELREASQRASEEYQAIYANMVDERDEARAECTRVWDVGWHWFEEWVTERDARKVLAAGRDEALAHCTELKEALDFWHDAFVRVRRQRDSWHKAWIRALSMVNDSLQERNFIRAALQGLLERTGEHAQEPPHQA